MLGIVVVSPDGKLESEASFSTATVPATKMTFVAESPHLATVPSEVYDFAILAAVFLV